MQLILASSSVYRRNLLKRLALPFFCITPDVDEAIVAAEAPDVRASRLARLKAESVTPEQTPTPTLVIGSDQVACLDGLILRKPGTVEQAVAQAKEKATCVTMEIARGPAEDSDVIAPPPPKPKQFEFLKKRTGALR